MNEAGPSMSEGEQAFEADSTTEVITELAMEEEVIDLPLAQERTNQLTERLSSINFGREDELLDWLCQYQEASQYAGVQHRIDEILETFRQHGYVPNMNVNASTRINTEDRVTMTGYIVGQALDVLKEDGYIPGFIHHTVSDWKDKFGHELLRKCGASLLFPKYSRPRLVVSVPYTAQGTETSLRLTKAKSLPLGRLLLRFCAPGRILPLQGRYTLVVL
jgi:hypothetical protein